jgi:hypothetical protein
MVAVVVSEVGRAFDLPDAFAQLLQWAPTASLQLVAFLNLRQLLASSAPLSRRWSPAWCSPPGWA